MCSHYCATMNANFTSCLSTQFRVLFSFRSQTRWLWRCNQPAQRQRGEFTLHHKPNPQHKLDEAGTHKRKLLTTKYLLHFPSPSRAQIDRARDAADHTSITTIPTYKITPLPRPIHASSLK